MDLIQLNLEVRKQLAGFSNTDPDDWFLCFKARFGTATALKAIFDIYGSGEVITQPYTCITAVNPILAASLKPIYTDTDPETLSLAALEKYYSAKTHAVIMQHTLGIIGNKVERITKFADRHHLILIEDSAHCLGRLASDSKGRPVADISIHSFGVEKVLKDTKFGGAIYINPQLRDKNPQLYHHLTKLLLDLPQPPRSLDLRARTYRFHNGILQRMPGRFYQSARNLSIKAHLLEPSVYPYEQAGEQANAFAPNKFVLDTILKNLPSLASNYNHRRKNVAFYHKYLANCPDFKIMTDVNEPLLAFPIIFPTAKEASAAYDMLTSSGFFIRRWYSPLLYPGPTNNRIYYYNPKMAPTAEAIHARVLCLPTDLSTAQLKHLAKILLPVEKPVQKIVKPVQK